MSAHPSRWPRDTASQDTAASQFLPTLPLELVPPPAPASRQRAASVREIWHDTHPQAGPDDEDTHPGLLDALPVYPSQTPSRAPAPDPADPLAGKFNEAVSGLQVRELDNDELFQRLFGAGS